MTPLDLDADEDRARWLLAAASARAEIESAAAGAGSVVVPAPVVRLPPELPRRRGHSRRASLDRRDQATGVALLRSLVTALTLLGLGGSAAASPNAAAETGAVASAESGGRAGRAPPPSAPGSLAPDGKARIDVNVASVEELCRLPGIGPRKAEAIAALRAKRRVTRPTQLLLVKGVGKKTLEKMLPYLFFPEVTRARGRREREVERGSAPVERAPPPRPGPTTNEALAELAPSGD